VNSSLAVLLEVKTTHSSAVLSLHLSQCFTPPLMNPRTHICPYSWALGICKNIGIRTYLASVAAESVGFSATFAFWRGKSRLATFFIALKNCIIYI